MDCLSHQCGAILVTGAMVDLSTAFTLATLAAGLSDTLFPPGDPLMVPVTVGLGALTLASWEATGEMAIYDYQSGPSATPGGALEHGGQGVIVLVETAVQLCQMIGWC